MPSQNNKLIILLVNNASIPILFYVLADGVLCMSFHLLFKRNFKIYQS